MSITRALPRLVGIDVAKELTFTGRVFDGAEASRLGVVTRTSPDPLAAARELGREIAVRSRTPSVAPSACSTSHGRDRRRTPGARGRAPTRLPIGSPNQLAAVAAGFTNEPAEFIDPCDRVRWSQPPRARIGWRPPIRDNNPA